MSPYAPPRLRLIRVPVQPAHVSELSVDVERRDGVVVARVAGQLDIYTAARLRQALDGIDPREVTIVLDLSGVDLVDSCGLGVLIHLHKLASSAGRRVILIVDGGNLHGVLRIAGLHDAFIHADTVESACELTGLPDRGGIPAP